MTLWAPIMTSLRDHQKASEAGDRAMWLYVCMHLFCKERDTNGRVSVHELKTLNAQRGKEALTLRLVECGLLETFEGGWMIAKYDEKGPKAANQAALREAWRDQKQAQRQGNVQDLSEIRAEQSRAEQSEREIPTEPSLSTDPSTTPTTQAGVNW